MGVPLKLYILNLFPQQWNRKAKRLATHGAPKTADSLKYLGTKAIASLQRNNCLPEQSSSPKPAEEPEPTPVTNLNPVYKVGI